MFQTECIFITIISSVLAKHLASFARDSSCTVRVLTKTKHRGCFEASLRFSNVERCERHRLASAQNRGSLARQTPEVNLLQQYVPGTRYAPHISSSRIFVARFPFSSHLFTKNHLSRFHCFTPWSQFRAGFPFSMLKTALESPPETQVETTRLMQSLTVYKPKRTQIFRFHHISFCMNAYASVMTNKFLCIILQLKQRISVLSMVKIDVKRAAEKHNAEWKSWPRWAPFALEQTPWKHGVTWSTLSNHIKNV